MVLEKGLILYYYPYIDYYFLLCFLAKFVTLDSYQLFAFTGSYKQSGCNIYLVS